jgi:riboflavin transporter FmnP
VISAEKAKTTKIAGATVFGALAWFLAVPEFFKIPFYPLTYLTFDFAEIPVMFSFLVFGPAAGIISSIVLWGTLDFVGSTGTFGATMKFIAVASSALGLWMGVSLYTRVSSRISLKRALFSGFFFSLLLRVVVMTVANYIALTVIFPDFMGFAVDLLAKASIVNPSSPFSGIIAILIMTGIYNVIHTALSLLPSYFLSTIPSSSVALKMGRPWITSIQAKKQNL